MRIPGSIPEGSLFHASLPRFDYIDVFGCGFSSQRELKPEDAVRAFFKSAPGWVRFLMALRDRIVGLIGLKTSGDFSEAAFDRFVIVPGNALGVFHIFAVGPHEIILGENDSHLDFRVLVRLEPDGEAKYRLIVATGVRVNNLLGRLYFIPVGMFHRRIVPAMLRGIVRNLAGPA